MIALLSSGLSSTGGVALIVILVVAALGGAIAFAYRAGGKAERVNTDKRLAQVNAATLQQQSSVLQAETGVPADPDTTLREHKA